MFHKESLELLWPELLISCLVFLDHYGEPNNNSSQSLGCGIDSFQNLIKEAITHFLFVFKRQILWSYLPESMIPNNHFVIHTTKWLNSCRLLTNYTHPLIRRSSTPYALWSFPSDPLILPDQINDLERSLCDPYDEVIK